MTKIQKLFCATLLVAVVAPATWGGVIVHPTEPAPPPPSPAETMKPAPDSSGTANAEPTEQTAILDALTAILYTLL